MRKKIVTMAIIAAMSGAMATTAITCSASTFADAAGVVSDGVAEAETSDEDTTDEEPEDESQPTATPKPEKKETKKKWFSITIWDILKQLSWAMVLMVIPGYYIFCKSKK